MAQGWELRFTLRQTDFDPSLKYLTGLAQWWIVIQRNSLSVDENIYSLIKMFLVDLVYIYIYIYIYIYWHYGCSVREWHGRPGFIPWSGYTKDLKKVLDTSLLNTQHYWYGSMIRGEIQGKEWHSPLHFRVIAIKKGPFESPSMTVS